MRCLILIPEKLQRSPENSMFSLGLASFLNCCLAGPCLDPLGGRNRHLRQDSILVGGVVREVSVPFVTSRQADPQSYVY